MSDSQTSDSAKQIIPDKYSDALTLYMYPMNPLVDVSMLVMVMGWMGAL